MASADEASLIAPELRATTLRGTPGFFRAGQYEAGQWWLLDPRGEKFWIKCVHGLRSAALQGDGVLPPDPTAQLRRWGFNSVASAAQKSSAGRDDGLPFLATADFSRAGRVISAAGLRLPDVFDPQWKQIAKARALEVCHEWADCRELIGWMTDDALLWAQPSLAGRPSLLQQCLSLEPSYAAYHAAWEFVLALHNGRIETLAQAWNAPLTNKEMVRELTRTEEGFGTRGYLRDEARWTREFARRYFTSTAAALRAADPNHLVFGCRFQAPAGAHVLAECIYPAVDVAMPYWTELPPPAERPLQPVLAGDVCWVGTEFLRPVNAKREGRLTTVERMLRRARSSLARLARHPAVVGYAWSEWQDEPREQPPFARGLIHTNGVEAIEHTEILVPFNRRAEALRRMPPSNPLP